MHKWRKLRLAPRGEARNGSRKSNKSLYVKTFHKNSSSKEFAPTTLVCNPQDAWETRLFNKTSSLPSSCFIFFFLLPITISKDLSRI